MDEVGFIHGVIDTDNISISGETFDYGPCAFMNSYDPETTYSSIDYNNSIHLNLWIILKWKHFKITEALLPIIHKNKEKSIQLAKSSIGKFDELWEEVLFHDAQKIGFGNNKKEITSIS